MPAFVTPIIDTAIGLVVIFIAFSLLASWLGEQIATIAQLRSKMLVSALEQLFSGTPGGGASMAQGFLANPIFTALKRNAQSNPQYLSAQQFSTILLGMVNPQGAPAQPGVSVVTTIQANAQALGIGSQVGALLAKANGDYDSFVKAVEDWFDDHMDRVSGWYKMRAQKILLLIGFILALLWNVDSLRITRALSCNAALRSSTAALAQSAAQSPAFVGTVLDAVPIGWQLSGDGPERTISCDRLSTTTVTGDTGFVKWSNVAWPWLPLKILGLIITGVALSLGAPFWFDVLSQLTRVRQAGKKPDTANPSTAG